MSWLPLTVLEAKADSETLPPLCTLSRTEDEVNLMERTERIFLPRGHGIGLKSTKTNAQG